jgi:hypothetical protein
MHASPHPYQLPLNLPFMRPTLILQGKPCSWKDLFGSSDINWPSLPTYGWSLHHLVGLAYSEFPICWGFWSSAIQAHVAIQFPCSFIVLFFPGASVILYILFSYNKINCDIWNSPTKDWYVILTVGCAPAWKCGPHDWSALRRSRNLHVTTHNEFLSLLLKCTINFKNLKLYMPFQKAVPELL